MHMIDSPGTVVCSLPYGVSPRSNTATGGVTTVAAGPERGGFNHAGSDSVPTCSVYPCSLPLGGLPRSNTATWGAPAIAVSSRGVGPYPARSEPNPIYVFPSCASRPYTAGAHDDHVTNTVFSSGHVQSSAEQLVLSSSSGQFVSTSAHVSMPEFAPSVTTSGPSTAVASGRHSYLYSDTAASSRASSYGGDDFSDAHSVSADAPQAFDSLLSPAACQDILVRL